MFASNQVYVRLTKPVSPVIWIIAGVGVLVLALVAFFAEGLQQLALMFFIGLSPITPILVAFATARQTAQFASSEEYLSVRAAVTRPAVVVQGYLWAGLNRVAEMILFLGVLIPAVLRHPVTETIRYITTDDPYAFVGDDVRLLSVIFLAVVVFPLHLLMAAAIGTRIGVQLRKPTMAALLSGGLMLVYVVGMFIAVMLMQTLYFMHPFGAVDVLYILVPLIMPLIIQAACTLSARRYV
jgi:hypothetical protein